MTYHEIIQLIPRDFAIETHPDYPGDILITSATECGLLRIGMTIDEFLWTMLHGLEDISPCEITDDF